MKNIAIFLFLVIIIFILSAINPLNCHAQKGIDYAFSLGVQSGFVYGQSIEIVYPANTMAELLSELLWDMKPVLYLGLQADYGRINPMSIPGIFASLSFKAGIPGDSGYLENRDWQSTQNTALTNYSRHTNATNAFLMLDLAVGASIPIGSVLYIKPFISGSWMHFSFTGRDGFYQYASGGGGIYGPIEDAPIISEYGKAITYQQDWLLIAAGLTAGTNYFAPFSFELTFQISPLTYCAAIDNHIKRNTIFNDYTFLGLFIEPKGRISFTVGNIDFSLEAAYRHIGRTRGVCFIKQGNNAYTLSASDSGAALEIFDARFIVSYRF